MKPVFFRGQNYDPIQLSRMTGQGYRATVPTADVITIASAKSVEAKVAVLIEGKHHLLTGSIDKAIPVQDLIVISKIVLKKALVQQTTYTERSELQRNENEYRSGMGYNSYRY